MVARYRALFSSPGFTRLLVSSLVGRLPSGMFSLAILLFVQARTGSFLVAGMAVGACTLTGALMGPLLGSLVDRGGQTRVLLFAAGAQGSMLVALVLVVERGVPAAAIVGMTALAGAAQPPIAGCVRALWPELALGNELETAYALDATAQETIWTVGPLLTGSVAGFVSPGAAVLLCAVITVLGTTFFATSTLSRRWRSDVRERSPGGALMSSGLRTLLGSVALAGTVIGAVEVGLPALAAHLGSRWSAGVLLAMFSLGSMLGGLLFSAWSWRISMERRYTAILLGTAVLVAPLIVSGSLTAGLVLSAIAGLGVAPMLSCQFSLVGALAPTGTRTEAFAWHRAATIGGMAGGSALGGALVDALGAGAPFALGCSAVALAGVFTLVERKRLAIAPVGSGASLVTD